MILDKRKAGYVMLYALIGMACLGVVAATVGKLGSMQLRPQRRIEQKTERASIARHFSERISCAVSAPHWSGTPDGGLVHVFDRLGQRIISADPAQPTRFREFTVRAVIRRFGNPGIDVQVARPKATNPSPLANNSPASEFETDPVFRNLAQDWSGDRTSVFASGALPCRTELNGGCLRSCPAGMAVRTIDPETSCVSCLDISCPAGEAFQGYHPTNGTKLCVPVPAPCPAEHIRVGNACKPVDAPGTGFTDAVAQRTRLQCRLEENLSPQIPQNLLVCHSDEFIAGVGGKCVNDNGQQLFGAAGGGSPRFPGYTNRNFAIATNRHDFNCYHFPQDGLQGKQVVRFLCCKKRGYAFQP
jgi:hypothetical protein